MEAARIEPATRESVRLKSSLAQPEEAGSLLNVLSGFFSGGSQPDDGGGPGVVPDGRREEAARRDIAAGLVALHAANFSAAKIRWQPLAEDGHAEAQYQLGKLYLNNGFSEASRPQGFLWLSRAASQQHAGALASKKALDSVMSREERVAARQLMRDVVEDKAGRP